MEIYHGDIIYSRAWDSLEVREDSYLVVDRGEVNAIFDRLPEQYAKYPVTDFGRGLIIPAFSDLHIHAPQYLQRGTGMDLLLADWLNHYTFPQESRFADPAHGEKVYELVVQDLIRNGTFHASILATIHRESTDILFRKLEERGLYAFVGKVNMDCGAPGYLCEDTEESLRETEQFLSEHTGDKKVRPILTPRFAPTCSEPLLKGLGKLAKQYRCGMQTHLVESRWEAAESLRLYPQCRSDAEIYEKAGLLDHGPSIFAHVIFPTADDSRIIRECGGYAVHCPDATTNVIAGIMPAADLHDQGVSLAIGSDIGAGSHPAVYRQIARTVQLSKLKEFYEPETNRTLTFENTFFLATKSGGSIFGKVGSLEPGYRFNALVIDDVDDPGFPMTARQRLERFCYNGDDRNIKVRYIDGTEVALV